ncbi:High-affinity methionine permease [Hyphodiscus hymeniophilus]|uniref:High-affinity methionine permease n=1 Tax=Hyphodiscus hymeniophilus TaxID=353542 RepID=A0A9P6VNI4_9HELO|nr:High-affinity methionine permease [Hyphodiscus hymeniophilus]
MADFNTDQVALAHLHLDENYQRTDPSPTVRQRLGRFTVVCLILNRTIGSGIFVTPIKVFNGTGSVGGSLLLWSFGGLIGTCGLLVWLELGLSVPLRLVEVMPGRYEKKSVPRSGGEKNYLEFIFSNPITGRPKFLVTCMYGIVFIILGNLSGNAVSFGTYIMDAAGKADSTRSQTIGIAVASLTAAILLHVCSRRGGIIMNNFFAVTKVLILIAMIILGFIKAAGQRLGGAAPATGNFAPSKSFHTTRHDIVSYTDSLLYVMYTYSGFEQPFYVLTEVAGARKIFPKYTLIAMFLATTLFVLINVAYLCAIPANLQGIEQAQDMATIFFSQLFGDEIAQRVMAALIAFSIFGNILVMTFTAARVKQEIAKEGILPFSLVLATGHTTPWAWLKNRYSHDKAAEEDGHLEQTPMAALALHWVSSIVLIAVTSMLQPGTAYSVLVSLYSYVVIVLNGFLVAGGLLLLKFTPSRNWSTDSNFTPWANPMHAIIYFSACGFVLFAAFVPPTDGSPYAYSQSHIQWFIVPTIGLSSLLWGLIWFAGLHWVMWRKVEELVVTRVAVTVPDEKVQGQFRQDSEVVYREWHTKVTSSTGSLDNYVLD